MKLLTSDLVGFIQQRHYTQVRRLRRPTLAIAVAGEEAASASFIRAKQRYGHDIGVTVLVKQVSSEDELVKLIKDWNSDDTIAGIVVQLPLPADFHRDKVLAVISPTKDVDSLGQAKQFESATAKAILWILASLPVDLKAAKVCVVGQGRLVGIPTGLALERSGVAVERCDVDTADLADRTAAADVVITGIGQPGCLTRDFFKAGAIVIDAGTAEAAGKLRGDVDVELYEDPTVRVTPVPGGVGPMTVAALFDNLLIAASG